MRRCWASRYGDTHRDRRGASRERPDRGELERTARAGYHFLGVGAKLIQRPFGRFVFAINPDGILVEFVEPAVRAR
jgi:hypothetical protein